LEKVSQWRLAKKQERPALSERERDRLKVLHEVEQQQLKQNRATVQPGMTERGFRKLLSRYREKRDYRDFGPTLAAEYLRKDLGPELSRETLHQLLTREGLWKAKPQKISEVHVWGPRRSCPGELVQWDAGTHAWLEERGPEKMRVLWACMGQYGKPPGRIHGQGQRVPAHAGTWVERRGAGAKERNADGPRVCANLKPGQIVVRDNLGAHKVDSVKAIIEEAGASASSSTSRRSSSSMLAAWVSLAELRKWRTETPSVVFHERL
jgi:hypothetical protein